MNTEKFTPGEWHRAFNRSRSGNGNVRGKSHCRIENENGVVIAFTVPQSSKQEQVANTNLIAAAPEMYRLLNQLHGALSAVPILQREIETVLKKAGGEE